MSECLAALRSAACDSLLARAPNGLDTVIGEGGVKVSGGEKQRLSIARALLRQPHLLVFDEATSSLDSLTEEGIVETIRDVAARRRCDHHPHRAPAVDDPARRSHLRPRAGPDRRDRPPRRAGRAQGAVLRDVAAADRRAPRKRERAHRTSTARSDRRVSFRNIEASLHRRGSVAEPRGFVAEPSFSSVEHEGSVAEPSFSSVTRGLIGTATPRAR